MSGEHFFQNPNNEAAYQRAWGEAVRDCPGFPQDEESRLVFRTAFLLGASYGCDKSQDLIQEVLSKFHTGGGN